MALTVNEISQAFLAETNLPMLSSVLSGDPGTKQILFLIYATGRDLLSRKCWPQLKRTHAITTVNGDSAYDLPTDFYSRLLETDWNTTDRLKMVGPMSDEDFNNLLYGFAVTSGQVHFRIFGRPGTNQFEVLPVPDGAQTLKFDYVSNGWINRGGGTFAETATSDSDTTVFDDDLMILGLKYRWLQAKGLDYQAYQFEYESKIEAALARYKGMTRGTFYTQTPGPNFMPRTPGNWSF